MLVEVESSLFQADSRVLYASRYEMNEVQAQLFHFSEIWQ
jgi:hypothetical protein